MKYFVGSGWWCSEESYTGNWVQHGDAVIRSQEFHQLWYQAVSKYTNPVKILIVDSASPIRPELNRDDRRLEFISLDQNYGHASDCRHKYCGVMRCWLLGISYAWVCDAEYYVYIEQDTLVYGEGIIERAISMMSKPYIFGDGNGTPQPVQVSLFIVHRSAFNEFLTTMDKISGSDAALCPEMKIAILGKPALAPIVRKSQIMRRLLRSIARMKFDFLPFGPGRTRPIDWNSPFLYFQFGTQEEIRKYIQVTGLKVTL
jgi:hypothetical protein